MSKIIIDNRSNIDDLSGINAVIRIIKRGRISNGGKQYCYLTVIHDNNQKYQISTFLNKESDRFVII